MAKQLLEYVIIYTSDGIPIYSRCFGNICHRSMKDDVLFSGFLSALKQFAAIEDKQNLKQIDFDGQKVEVHFDDQNQISSLEFSDMDLLFHYIANEEVTIAVGGSNTGNVEQNPEMMKDLLDEIELFMENWDAVNWRDVSKTTLDDFEKHLLGNVVHPFLDKYGISESCMMGKNCPFRKSMYEGEGTTLYDKMRNHITKLREQNMLKSMYQMITGRISAIFE